MGKDEERSLVGSWRVLAPLAFDGARAQLLVLSLLSFLGGLAEAAVLVVVVDAGVSLAENQASITNDLPIMGPADLTMPQILGLGAVLLAVRLGLQLTSVHMAARLATRTMVDLRRRTHAAFLRSQWQLQSQEEEGHLEDLVNSHVGQVANATLTVASGLVAFATFAALTLSAFVVDAGTAVAVIVAVVLLFMAFRPAGRVSRRQATEQAERNLTYVEGIAQDVRLARDIQTFDVTEAVIARDDARAEAVGRAHFARTRLAQAIGPLYQSLALAALLLGLGAIHVSGSSDLASLGALVLILLRALNSGQQLQSVHHSLNQTVPFAQRLQAALDVFEGAGVVDGDQPLERIEELGVDRVGFAYEPGRPVLVDVDFTVARGEAVGIIGPSGGGKSTLVQLLLRLRDPDRGRVVVNGGDAAKVRLADWYRHIAYVPQDPQLTSGSIRDNIVFGRTGVDDEAVERAARLAHIHDDVVSWPEGYDTPAGARGGALSGGQRQRLCIARALLTDPDVLILDEPTSSLDADAESVVAEALETLRGERTVLIVAHRLSTLRMCDRLMVIEQGRLVANEPASALSRREGFYRRALEQSRAPEDAV